jgi:hypothetical protein
MPSSLYHRLANGESGYLFYGITPPKLGTDTARLTEIALRQIERLRDMPIDALVLYDLQDESSRNAQPRPFPFMATLPPEEYAAQFLQSVAVPKIIYQSIGKHTPASLKAFCEGRVPEAGHSPAMVEFDTNIAAISHFKPDLTVWVGSPSRQQTSALSLAEAYALRNTWVTATKTPDFGPLLGGVTIPERHLKAGNEHLRVIEKTNQGCAFFISQCVYNAQAALDFLSDYHYETTARGLKRVPLIFTLTPCGSPKTLHFMEWLGIDIPRWLKNELQHSGNTLEQSLQACLQIARDLLNFARAKSLPIGFNIESVAVRKEEIAASLQLVHDVKALMR